MYFLEKIITVEKMTTLSTPKLATENISAQNNSTTIMSFSHSKHILLSCIIGNALEWYDFIIYSYFIIIFGSLFFPHASPLAQILASWGIFWSGFLARPIGSLIFGHIGDKISRKYALTLSIIIMAIPTTLIGFLPTYQQIGLLAPLFLILLRTVQGFAIGGEYTGTMVFLVEHAPKHQRGLWGSCASFSAVIGVIAGSLLVAFLNIILSPEAMKSWAWRLPFILSMCGSLIGAYIRFHLSDPQVYLDLKERKAEELAPIKDVILHHKSKIGCIILLDFLTAVGFFTVAIFFVTYFRTYLKFSEHAALSIHTFNMIILAVSILIGGWLSDKYGRKPILGIPCAILILISYPLFQLLPLAGHLMLLCVQGVFAIVFGLFFGAIPSALAEIMPTHVRFSGLSIGHNVCMAVIGGGAPFLASCLIHYTGNLASPAFLLIIASFISLYSLRYFTDKYKTALMDDIKHLF